MTVEFRVGGKPKEEKVSGLAESMAGTLSDEQLTQAVREANRYKAVDAVRRAQFFVSKSLIVELLGLPPGTRIVVADAAPDGKDAISMTIEHPALKAVPLDCLLPVCHPLFETTRKFIDWGQ